MTKRDTTKTKAIGAKRYSSDDERWQAVLHRDARADGKFYYSVKTTGVYCRPLCTARRALRRNVVFYDSCEDAERDGFRPCKRCQPNGPTLGAEYAAKIAEACRTIETSADAPRLEALAKRAAMSQFHFHRVFVRLTGLTPKRYAQARRAERTRQALIQPGTVTGAIYAAGFNSNGRFYGESSRMLGMKPKTFQRGGDGEAIRFAVGECALGSILVAASAKGVCAISLGNDPDRLVRELQAKFAQAQLIAGDRDFERLVARVVGFVAAPQLGLDLPLDVRGTVFQRRVWEALCAIPPGATATYAEVARRLGRPRSARAVAGACAANPLAVAIPCHRVVRTGGGMAGYRWGIERKRALLLREGRRVESPARR